MTSCSVRVAADRARGNWLRCYMPVQILAFVLTAACTLPHGWAFSTSILSHAAGVRPLQRSVGCNSFLPGTNTVVGSQNRAGRGALRSIRALLSEDDEEDLQRMKDERVLPFDKGSSEFIPSEMQPANEWLNLKEEFLFDWTLLPEKEFAIKLGGVFGFFFFFVSLPIAGTTYDAPEEWLLRFLASCIGGTSVESVYFESDERRPITTTDLQRLGYRSQGAMWIKPPEILARDRLMKQMEVNPVMEKLKKTTGGLAVGLLSCIVLFNAFNIDAGFDPRFIESEQRLQDLNNPSNEAIANREGERLRKRGNKPAYCYSRYYKSIASSDAGVCAD